MVLFHKLSIHIAFDCFLFLVVALQRDLATIALFHLSIPPQRSLHPKSACDAHIAAMNDPGLHEQISDAAGAVQEKYSDDEAGSDVSEEEEEKSFLMPARWWYASTAFPLIAGTFGPMANAFSLCALVENWRVSIPPGGTEEHGIDIPDPKW